MAASAPPGKRGPLLEIAVCEKPMEFQTAAATDCGTEFINLMAGAMNNARSDGWKTVRRQRASRLIMVASLSEAACSYPGQSVIRRLHAGAQPKESETT